MTETAIDPALLCGAVELACRAPSLHNSQPWRWVATGSTVHLYADLSRAMTTADPLGREVYLSCGAALDHFVVAIAAEGWDTVVHRFPDPREPLHVAAIECRPGAGPVTDDCLARAKSILARRTDRRPFGAPTDRTSLEVMLRQTLIPYHVMCDVVLDEARPCLAEASQLTESIRHNDPSYEAELAWWTSTAAPQGGLGARGWPAAERDHSMIMVLSTSGEDSRNDVLRCGEGLSAVLLAATMAGLATCTLTHMTELAQSREILRRLTGERGLPQLLLRVGEAEPEDTAPTARRPISEVLEFTD